MEEQAEIGAEPDAAPGDGEAAVEEPAAAVPEVDSSPEVGAEEPEVSVDESAEIEAGSDDTVPGIDEGESGSTDDAGERAEPGAAPEAAGRDTAAESGSEDEPATDPERSEPEEPASFDNSSARSGDTTPAASEEDRATEPVPATEESAAAVEPEQGDTSGVLEFLASPMRSLPGPGMEILADTAKHLLVPSGWLTYYESDCCPALPGEPSHEADEVVLAGLAGEVPAGTARTSRTALSCGRHGAGSLPSGSGEPRRGVRWPVQHGVDHKPLGSGTIPPRGQQSVPRRRLLATGSSYPRLAGLEEVGARRSV